MSSQIENLVSDLYHVTTQEKELKARKEELRDELFGVANREQPEHLLPTATIEVPFEFFNTTGMTYDDFLKSRFPTWDLQDYEVKDNSVVFILRKGKSYMPWKYEDDYYKLSKSPVEPTPEIDWDTLEIERPDLFGRLAKEKITYEVNEEEFNKLLQEDPTVYEVLRRHSKFTRAVSQRVGVKVND